MAIVQTVTHRGLRATEIDESNKGFPAKYWRTQRVNVIRKGVQLTITSKSCPNRMAALDHLTQVADLLAALDG